MKKALLFAVMLLMVFSAAVAGCSGGKSSSGGNSGGGSEGGGGESGGNTTDTLIYGRGADSVRLDPALVTDGESFKVTQQIFDTLVDFKKGSTEIRPMLATEWEIKNNGKTYIFHLREDVKFTNGEKFTADAVVYNFERWMAGNNENIAYYPAMFGGFKGDESHVIESVQAVDDYTVKFELKRTFAPFLKNLAMPPFAIASPKALKKFGDKFSEHPVGTGPFQLVEWAKNDKVVLKKNENYWRDGYPKLSKIIYRVIPDNSARLNALKTGAIDMMDGLNPSDVGPLKKNDKFQIWNRPPLNVAYMFFNNEVEPFNNPKVRVALNHAVNKAALNNAFYGGTAQPAKNPLPPTVAGYNDNIEPYEFNLDKAKKLLAEAGYPDGFKMELWTMSNPRPYLPNPSKIAEAIQASFGKIGVDVEIRQLEWANYLAKVKEGAAPAGLLGWIGDNGTADNFLNVLFNSNNIGTNNYARYKNEKVDQLLAKAQSTVSDEERYEIYKQVQVILHKEAPWIPLVHYKQPLVGDANIKGFVPNPTGTDQLYDVYFE